MSYPALNYNAGHLGWAMPLAAGKQLGPYEIEAAIGAGGMGEVYRARDTRLGRTVAIKVLPEGEFASDEARRCFQREARVIAGLSHPHICTIHDIGDEQGLQFIVMEYLEGETLAARLERGPLPAAQVLQYGIEIADALEKAHRARIIHRDLKPGNIMLTKSGTKLLDFGLARITHRDSAPLMSALTALPTEDNSNITGIGAILGTLQYMAPEQLEARDTDARTDIFAFGAVLYEIITGQRAFRGKSQASLIAAILSSQPPPLLQLSPLSPPALDRVVRTCLEKDPEERWQTAHDVRLQLSGSVMPVRRPAFPASRHSAALLANEPRGRPSLFCSSPSPPPWRCDMFSRRRRRRARSCLPFGGLQALGGNGSGALARWLPNRLYGSRCKRKKVAVDAFSRFADTRAPGRQRQQR